MVKIFQMEDIQIETPIDNRPTLSVRRVVNEKTGASKFGVFFVEISKETETSGFHYHVKRELVYIVVEGKAKLTIDGNIHIIESNSVVFISPGEKHRVENIGDNTFKMIEVYSPLEPDRVEVLEG